MAKKHATTTSRKSSQIRHNRSGLVLPKEFDIATLGKAVEQVTNKKLLSQIERLSLRLDDLGRTREYESKVPMIDLCVEVNHGMRQTVQWFVTADDEIDIADAIGTIIAATRLVSRA